ncbi:YcjX family protein [Sulfurimonas sp.]|uniref:YcjX family protein n=1 Tax=Sulfurimonas sp. TaxID=2022749 RepID=UPI002607A4D7|nr:YcjX family protein [Sulfurimonas sp.]
MVANILKNLPDLPSLSFTSTPIKIAITGLSRSGKTVFITSLIDQLLYQDKILSVTASYQPFKTTIKAPLANAKRFDYYTLIHQLKQEYRWTKDTDEITHTILEIQIKSRFALLSNTKFQIELIDYPGEWLLDLTLLEMSYTVWSQKTLTWLRSVDDDKARAYLTTLNSLTAKTNTQEVAIKVHKEYKELLIHLKKNNYSQLTPGRFIMPSDLANDPILIFAPLPLNAAKELQKSFEKRYNKYVKEIVKDIQLEHFKGFERQVVLVDVLEALQNGYDCYSDMKSGLKSMLALYEHKNKNFLSQWFHPSIKKVLFCATKADQVAASQHTNFSALLVDMIEDLQKDLDISHIETTTQIVAALKSTMTIEKKYKGQTLSFIRGILEEDAEMHDLYPGEMPPRFPNKAEFDTSKYGYKNFLPQKKPYRDNESLEHINMDRVIRKLIGDLL